MQYNKASGNIDECGFISASGLGFKNQIGNTNAIDWQQIQADFATYGARKCSDNGASMCKCDCNLDGITDFVIPVPPEAIGNWIPNYPLPTSFLHATIIDFLCCLVKGTIQELKEFIYPYHLAKGGKTRKKVKK